MSQTDSQNGGGEQTTINGVEPTMRALSEDDERTYDADDVRTTELACAECGAEDVGSLDVQEFSDSGGYTLRMSCDNCGAGKRHAPVGWLVLAVSYDSDGERETVRVRGLVPEPDNLTAAARMAEEQEVLRVNSETVRVGFVEEIEQWVAVNESADNPRESTYLLGPNAESCTCKGYKYRGECKHVSAGERV